MRACALSHNKQQSTKEPKIKHKNLEEAECMEWRTYTHREVGAGESEYQWQRNRQAARRRTKKKKKTKIIINKIRNRASVDSLFIPWNGARL